MRPSIFALTGSLLVAALAVACAAVPRAPPAPAAVPAHAAARPGWPDTWGIDFAFRCSRAGHDLRFCTCVATEVQARFTPEELEASGPAGVDEAAQACDARLRGGN